MKSITRLILRKLTGTKENETIVNSLNRQKIRFKKIIYRQKISSDQFKQAVESLEIERGDNLMIHASWRDCFNLNMSPAEVINVLKEEVGESGTLLMPCYGADRAYLDVQKTPSAAGVLSEVFRKSTGSLRSECTHFSVVAQGAYAKELLSEHNRSKYGFDEFSPYYKFSQLKNSKILFLGLGKKPTQISLFHCAGWMLKDTDSRLNSLYNTKYKATLINNGCSYEKNMIIRNKGHENNNKIFKKVFLTLNKTKSNKISNLDLVIIDANEAMNKAVEFNKKRIYFYKNMS